VSNPDTRLDQSGLATVFKADGSVSFDRVFERARADWVNDIWYYGAGNAAAFAPDGDFIVGGVSGTDKLDYDDVYSWVVARYDRSGNGSDWSPRTGSEETLGVG